MSGNLERVIEEVIRDIRPALDLLEAVAGTRDKHRTIKAFIDMLDFPAWVKNDEFNIVWSNRAHGQVYDTCSSDCAGKPVGDGQIMFLREVIESDAEALSTRQPVIFDDYTTGQRRKIIKLAVNVSGDDLIFGVSLPHHALADAQDKFSLRI